MIGIPRGRLLDREVRRMAMQNHTPTESWTFGGVFAGIHCDECGHTWPCPTRRAIDELQREDHPA